MCTKAAILTAFQALLRKCELTDSESVLLGSDFKFYSWRMLISVRRSKTIQFSERELLIPVACVPNTDLYAIHWVWEHFSQTKMGASEPAFQVPVADGGFQPLD